MLCFVRVHRVGAGQLTIGQQAYARWGKGSITKQLVALVARLHPLSEPDVKAKQLERYRRMHRDMCASSVSNSTRRSERWHTAT